MGVRRVAFIGTYPPTRCGLATFTSALRNAMGSGIDLDASPVIRVVDRDDPRPKPPEVVLEWRHGDPDGATRVIDAISDVDLCIVQHEYGIFDGPDGAAIVEVLEQSATPTISVLHTVLTEPSTLQRAILESVCAASDAVVTQSRAARRRLLRHFDVAPDASTVIAHGADPNLAAHTEDDGAPIVLTWGLIGPGKGLEHAVAAMARLTDITPAPRYLVAGETHPNVLAREGERYRDSLRTQAERLGVANHVEFDDRYRTLDELAALVRSARIVLLPYESRDQVTSGVLVEALAAGKPVVATAFPHAREVLGNGAGILVPHDDPAAMADALRTLLTDETQAAIARARAAAAGRNLLWPEIGRRYLDLGDRVVAAAARTARPLLLA